MNSLQVFLAETASHSSGLAWRGTTLDGKYPGSLARGIFIQNARIQLLRRHPVADIMGGTCSGTRVEMRGYWRRAGEGDAGLFGLNTRSLFIVLECVHIETENDRVATRLRHERIAREQNDSRKRPEACRKAFDEAFDGLLRFGGATPPKECATLGLSELPSTKEALRAAWRARIRSCHPDTGGSEAAAQAVNSAYQTLLERFQ